MLGFKKQLNYSYDYSVLNNKKEKITIEILDQIPVAQKDEISVELEEDGGGEINEKSGEVKWELQLDSKQRKDWEFGYSVKYPKGKQISGTK